MSTQVLWAYCSKSVFSEDSRYSNEEKLEIDEVAKFERLYFLSALAVMGSWKMKNWDDIAALMTNVSAIYDNLIIDAELTLKNQLQDLLFFTPFVTHALPALSICRKSEQFLGEHDRTLEAVAVLA